MKSGYVVIQGWMYSLGLALNEIIAYATIFGFSQDGESVYNGSRRFLASRMACASTRTVDKVLNTLVERGLVLKTSRVVNGITFCDYRVNPDMIPGAQAEPVAQAQTPVAAPVAPSVPAVPAAAPKAKATPADILTALMPAASGELVNAWTELCETKKWQKKAESALRAQAKKLTRVPEIEAMRMVENAIGGEWEGLWELKPEEKAALYGQNAAVGAYPAQGGGFARPAVNPAPTGVMAAANLIAANQLNLYPQEG